MSDKAHHRIISEMPSFHLPHLNHHDCTVVTASQMLLQRSMHVLCQKCGQPCYAIVSDHADIPADRPRSHACKKEVWLSEACGAGGAGLFAGAATPPERICTEGAGTAAGSGGSARGMQWCYATLCYAVLCLSSALCCSAQDLQCGLTRMTLQRYMYKQLQKSLLLSNSMTSLPHSEHNSKWVGKPEQERKLYL